MWHTIIICNHECCELNEIKTVEYALMYTKLKCTLKIANYNFKISSEINFFYKIKKYKWIVWKKCLNCTT